MLAIKAKAPVYLVAHNAGEFWPKNSFIKRPGVVQVYINPPLDVAEMSASEVNQQIENWLVTHLENKTVEETN